MSAVNGKNGILLALILAAAGLSGQRFTTEVERRLARREQEEAAQWRQHQIRQAHEIYAVGAYTLPAYSEINKNLKSYTGFGRSYLSVSGAEFGGGLGYFIEMFRYGPALVGATGAVIFLSGQRAANDQYHFSFSTLNGFLEIAPFFRLLSATDIGFGLGVITHLYFIDTFFMFGKPALIPDVSFIPDLFVRHRIGSVTLRMKVGYPLGQNATGLYVEAGAGFHWLAPLPGKKVQ